MSDSDARILIVDDSEDSLAMVRRFLESKGYHVQTAKNGEEAILRAGADGPDLIVLDLAMPVLDGWESCRYFKVKFTSRFLPIVIVSGRDDPEEIGRSAEHGADDFLFKPLDFSALRDTIERLLRLRDLDEPAQEQMHPDGDIEGDLCRHLEVVMTRNRDFATRKAQLLIDQHPGYRRLHALLERWKDEA
ncbi:MAG: response regulator [Myxococcales bacterium]|nr:response regulator [Myxococcales bacterium]